MKEWARWFYNSTAWKDTAAAYMMYKGYICERCGEPAKICHHRKYITRANINNPYITLNWENLEALCQDCHNKEHHKQEPKLRYRYDEEGNIIFNTPLSAKKI